MVSLVGAAQTSIGTFPVNTNVNVFQTCDACGAVTISAVTYPNSTIALESVSMSSGDTYYYNYTLTSDYTGAVGTYTVNGFDDATNSFAYDFTITSSGNPTPDSMPFLLGLITLIIFGVAVFFLIVSTFMSEPGPKIFFLISAMIFIFSSVALTINIAQESNIAESIDGTLGGILLAIGAIFVVIVAYILIRQTVAALDMYKEKKGLSWGGVGTGYRYAGMQQPNSPY